MNHPSTTDLSRLVRHLTTALLVALVLAGLLTTVSGQPPPAGAAGIDGRIAFASDADGDLDIYTVDPEGTNRTNLTTGSPARDTHPVWSGDNRIAFTSERDGDPDIYTMKEDGSDVRQITDSPGVDARPTWSPDGTKVAFRSDRSGSQQVHVARLDVAGYPTTKLTTGSANNTEPSWGAGGRIAFTSNRDGDREVFVMDADGTDVHQVTSNGADDGSARWVSPARLVFQSKAGGDFEIAEIDADGTDRVAITNTAANEGTPVRSPGGTMLAYTRAAGSGRALVVAQANGSGATTIASASATNELPDWNRRHFVFKPRQSISNVTLKPHGTRVTVDFDTRIATDGAHVELWNGTTMRWAWDQGAAVKHHQLFVRFLKPNTSYTLKVFAPREVAAGEVTYAPAAPVKTLIRKVTFHYGDAYVYNDGDVGTCGEIKVFVDLDGHSYSNTWGQQEACGGPLDLPPLTYIYDDAPYDDMLVHFDAWDDDADAACGIHDDCLDIARGSTTVTLVNDVEVFSGAGSVHLFPDGDALNLVVDFTYTVSYHA